MVGLVLPTNNRSVILKTFTLGDIKKLYHIRDNIEYTVEFLNSFILSKDVNILEKFYCFLHLRDTCIGNIINYKEFSFDINNIQAHLEEIIDIRRTYRFNENDTITLNYPFNFSCKGMYKDSFIEKIVIDNEEVIYNELDEQERDLIFDYLPDDIKKEIDKFYTSNIQKLNINFLLKGEYHNLDLATASCIHFLINLFCPLNMQSYREYIFVLSKRIKDVNFLVNSSFVDIKDYMDLYVKEAKENKTGIEDL